MTECDSASTDVHLRWVNAKDIGTVDSHRSESLIELDDIDVVLEIEIELAKELGDRERRTDAHDPWGDASNCGTAEFGHDWLIHFDRF